jgi:hypothetical protein
VQKRHVFPADPDSPIDCFRDRPEQRAKSCNAIVLSLHLSPNGWVVETKQAVANPRQLSSGRSFPVAESVFLKSRRVGFVGVLSLPDQVVSLVQSENLDSAERTFVFE